MLHEQHLKDAAMEADESMYITTIPGLGLNPGPLALKADDSTTELLRHVTYTTIRHVFIEDSIQRSTAMKWLYSRVLSTKNQQLQYSAAIRCWN